MATVMGTRVPVCRWRVKMAWSPQLDCRTAGGRASGERRDPVLLYVNTQKNMAGKGLNAKRNARAKPNDERQRSELCQRSCFAHSQLSIERNDPKQTRLVRGSIAHARGECGQGGVSTGHGLTGAMLRPILEHELALETFHEALMVAIEDQPPTPWQLCARLLAFRQR